MDLARQHYTLLNWLQQRGQSELDTIAYLWGLGQTTGKHWSVEALGEAILQETSVTRVLAGLDEGSYQALMRLLAEEGARLPAHVLEREWGTIRAHESYPNPRAYLLALKQAPSATERLYTLGLIQLVRQQGGRWYLVPEDLLPFLPKVAPREKRVRFQTVDEPAVVRKSDPFQFERHVVEFMALAERGELQLTPQASLHKTSITRIARRWGRDSHESKQITRERSWPYLFFVRCLLLAAGLLRISTKLELIPTRDGIAWLRLPRIERSRRLLQAWLLSPLDELDDFCGVKSKSYPFGRDLKATREEVLRTLADAPKADWIDLQAFIQSMQQVNPDFLRRDGRYDNWGLVDYLQRPLNGYEHWHAVEGQLLAAYIGRSLFYLGLVDWGGASAKQIDCFRLTPLAESLLTEQTRAEPEEDEALLVQSTFELVLPPRASCNARFWTICAAQWQPSNGSYTLTKQSVQSLLARGVELSFLIELLQQESGRSLPPNVEYTLKEWGGQLGQLSLEQAVLLRSVDPVLLEQVRRDRRVRMPPHEQISPTLLKLDQGEAKRLLERLQRAGYGVVSDGELEQNSGLSEHDLTILYGALEFYVTACSALEIDSEASDALRRRVMRMLNQKQRQQAVHMQADALRALRSLLEDDQTKGQ